ncbi:MAG TPA: tRNA (adenosine(37)-N6)-threonylcarbamoyltransferase complex dimerization subunit type 1 TsaB [Steroidobacteraceae bacterium]|nr:tRNA (adenosine(37)-N6)-threonylcarbamoyltransferase complex dimerization subunit type 1 TsaB [Steroidobacteraceae bacterium]
MKILAFDTATEACSVALGLDDHITERYVELERGHAERLLPMVDELLSEGGVALGALDAIAFGRGPGAFTGVRLAASVAQGLAFGAGLGVAPVSDLAAVARRVIELQPGVTRILVVSDARMREVYWGHFRGDSRVTPAGDEHVSAGARVEMPADCDESWAAAGRGLVVAPDLAERCRAAGAVLHADLLPRAREILLLARPAVAAGDLLPPERALPVYVRDRVAAASM